VLGYSAKQQGFPFASRVLKLNARELFVRADPQLQAAFAARTLAQRALAAAEMAARPALLIRLFFGADAVPAAFAFAQRALRALARALISLRRCATDSLRFVRLVGAGASVGLAAATSPVMASSSPFNAKSFSLIAITRLRSTKE